MKRKIPKKKGIAKVPVMIQMETLECGAVCLDMILAYYDKWIPIEKVRVDCAVSRDGVNAKNILRAARRYGFKAGGFRFEKGELRKDGEFPCIVHWEFNHFVVCKGYKGNKVYLNDPARGNIVVTEEEFERSFTGVCLGFEPGENFKPEGKRKNMIGYAAKRLKGLWVAIFFVFLTTLVMSLLGVINAGFSKLFIDQLLENGNNEIFMPFMAAVISVSLIYVTVLWIRAVYMIKLDGKMAVVGNSSFMWHILRLPMEFFLQRTAGDIKQRQSANSVIASNLVNIAAPLAIDLIMIIFYLAVMLRYSVILSCVGISAVMINILLSRYTAEKRVNITRVMMRDRGKLLSATVSGIDMIETIKASGAENGYFRKWAGYQASENTQNIRFVKYSSFLGMLPQIFTQTANTAVLIIGVYLVMTGRFTDGMILAFQGILSSFTAPANNLTDAGRILHEMRTDMERIDDCMEYPKDDIFRDIESNREAGKLSGNVEIKNLTFGYAKFAEPLIQDINISIKRGKSTAIVGSSGCGKSTISKLISGLYKPWSGEILFDGKKISDIDRNVFKGSVAVVDQDIILFEDTISNNIKMWDNSIEDFEVIMAARDAHIHDEIMKLTGGYDHKLTEGGRNLSGGQRQRLEIARVLAGDPTIIIMDEATSALDAKTEYEVVKAINERGITCIIIAHRLSTIRDCDWIIVLDQGKIAEQGTHDELMGKNGKYAELISSD